MNKEIKNRIVILGMIGVLLIIGGSIIGLLIRDVITLSTELAWFIIVISIAIGFIGIYNLVKLYFLFESKSKGGLSAR